MKLLFWCAPIFGIGLSIYVIVGSIKGLYEIKKLKEKYKDII